MVSAGPIWGAAVLNEEGEMHMARFLTPFQSRSFDNPFLDLHREMNRLLDDFAGAGAGGGGDASRGGGLVSVPRMDVRENDKTISVCCELPGVKPSDVDLRIEGDLLTIRGEKKDERQEQREDYHLMERSFGKFQRSIQLPFSPNPDEVRADFKDGVLTVILPKRAEQERSRRIQIEAGSGSDQQAQINAPQKQEASDVQPKGQSENQAKKHH